MMRISLIWQWLKRKPRPIEAICPSCQRRMMTGQSKTPPWPPTDDPIPDSARRLMAQQAADGFAEVDAIRQQQSTGEPLRDQALADIQAGFARNVVDIARKLRRPDEPGAPR